MPELPEVERIAMGLRNEILGCRVVAVTVHQPLIVSSPLGRKWPAELRQCSGLVVSAVTRRAKRLIIVLGDDRLFVVQLGMTGRFMIQQRGQKRVPHTHFSVAIADGRRIDYIDPRRFGRLWVMGQIKDDWEQAMEKAGLGKLGPEPFKIKLTEFVQIFQSKRPVKNLLLDQGRIAGLGNIYADEALFAAGIDPRSVSSSIPLDKLKRLRCEIPKLLQRSIRHGGTTFSDFRNPYGEPGRFLRMLKVYGRTHKACRQCGILIEKIMLAGRSTHFCPNCQQRYL